MALIQLGTARQGGIGAGCMAEAPVIARAAGKRAPTQPSLAAGGAHPAQKMPWLELSAPSPGCGFRPGSAAESSRPTRPSM